MRRRGLRVDEQVFHDAAGAAGFRLEPEQAQAARRLAGWTRTRRVRGVYLWGRVGRGKTWLADTYADAVAGPRTRRVHSHELLRDLHAAVHRRRDAGHPVAAAVDDLLDGLDLLCFDELDLQDPGDAMLFTRLLRHLLDRRTALVVTSNHAPEQLLPDPLHHHLVLPAVGLLREHLDVVEVGGSRDHREPGHGAGLHGRLLVRMPDPPRADERTALPVGSRTVPALAVRAETLWVDFADVCEARTAAADYLALAARFPRWVLTGVPPLAEATADARQRFVLLVDVLHDRGAEVTLVSEHPLDRLLEVAQPPPGLVRTASRLRLLGGCALADSGV